jgi:hypothetical protein
MLDLQNGLKMRNIYDFQFESYNDFTLKLIGSFDFAYYHNVEITFYGVSFVMCPTKFMDANIRLASSEEYDWFLKNNRINYMEDDDILFCFTIRESAKYFILAEKFDYIFEEVLYYKKDNLEKGQRIAEWVK